MSKKIVETRISRLKKEIIPRIVWDGKIKNAGSDSKIEDIVIKNAEEGSDHWASATLFVEVHLKTKNNDKITEKLVVKYCPADEEFSKKILADIIYKNEVNIYTKVFPKYREFIKNQSEKLNNPELNSILDGLFPLCYFAEYDEKNPIYSVVVLNDVGQFGYKLAPHRINLDVNHVKLVMTKIGKYHGAGYAYKISNKTEYENVLSCLTRARFTEESRKRAKFPYLHVQIQRALRRLLKDQSEDVNLEEIKRLDEIFEKAYDVMIYLTRKSESAVLCHGDFCANNLLFKYNSGGNPENAILIDFQTPFYSSPAIDLSFFLLVGTDQHFRNQYFNEIFQVYHSSVIETMTKILGRPIEEPSFTLHDFKKDFVDHAAYGYGICSFFLPIMMNIDKEPFDLMADLKKDDTMDPVERRKEVENRGGEAATQVLVSLFTELYDKHCFDDILKNYSVDTHL